jgi:DNA-directed RNA polymerase subunit RPC12/RpoP
MCAVCGRENDLTRNFARCFYCAADLMVQGTIRNPPEETWSCDKQSEGSPCPDCGGALLQIRATAAWPDLGQTMAKLKCPKCGFQQTQIGVTAREGASASAKGTGEYVSWSL